MRILLFGGGVLVGVALAVIVVWWLAPGLMLSEKESSLTLDETVKRITDRATAEGWVVNAVRPLDENVKKHGGPEVRKVRLVEICHPRHAGKILLEDDARIASVMMPCTISVYEKSDGSIWVGSMNPGLMGRVFGGVISEVMAGPVAEAQEKFLASFE